jgi:hypothetical protein
VKSDAAKPCLLDEALEGAVVVARVNGGADGGREDEVGLLPHVDSVFSRFRLELTVGLQGTRYRSGQGKGSVRALGLGPDQGKLPSRLEAERTPDVQSSVREVDVFPAQAQRLSLA